jgi:hypothetical protein
LWGRLSRRAQWRFVALKKLKLGWIGALLALVSLWGCNDQGSSTSSSTSSVSSSSSGGSSTSAAPAPSGSPSATLSWEAPTSNTNGTALTDLSGYRIYYGSSASDLSSTVQVNSGVQTYVFDNLQPGTWYFAIMAVTSAGTESAMSNVVSTKIT